MGIRDIISTLHAARKVAETAVYWSLNILFIGEISTIITILEKVLPLFFEEQFIIISR